MLNFLKELPTIYLVFFSFLILIGGYFFTKEQNLFTLANLALGAIVGIARVKEKATQEIEEQNIERVILPPNVNPQENNTLTFNRQKKPEAKDDK